MGQQNGLDQVIENLSKPNLTRRNPGQIIEGAALGIEQYFDPLVQASFKKTINLSEYFMWNFLFGWLDSTINPHQIKSQREVYSTKDLYDVVLDEIRIQDLIVDDKMEGIINNFDSMVKNRRMKNGKMRVYHPETPVLYVSGREKIEGKIAKKVSLMLVCAELEKDGINIDLNLIDNPSEKKYVEKSRLDDFHGARIVFRNEDDLYLYLNMNPSFQRQYKIQFSNNVINGDEESWTKQIERGYPAFVKNKKNGYRSVHLDIQNMHFPNIRFELQMLVYDWLLINEGTKPICHDTYDKKMDIAIEMIPEKYEKRRKTLYDRVIHFYKLISEMSNFSKF